MAQQRRTIAASRQLVQKLRTLGDADAPPSLLPDILTRLGLGDQYAILDTPIGPLFVAYNDQGISAIMRSKDAAEFVRDFRARFGRTAHAAAEAPAGLIAALTEHLNGGSSSKLRFDLRGLSSFERAVLLKTLEIPYGEVRPYAWVAREIGHPKAVRAVGVALGNNPIPLLIPCHRIVRSDGRIGNYIFGSQTKRAALAAEGAAPDVLETLARAGVRYYGDATNRIYCFPSCTGLHRRTDRQFIKFHSEREAVTLGYRPCEVCRPAPPNIVKGHPS